MQTNYTLSVQRFSTIINIILLLVLNIKLYAEESICQPELQLDRNQFYIRSKSGNDNIINSGEQFIIEVNVHNNSFDCTSGNYNLTYMYGGRTSSSREVPNEDNFKIFDTSNYAGISPQKFGGKKNSNKKTTVNLSGTHWVKVCVDTNNNLNGGDCMEAIPFEVSSSSGSVGNPEPYITYSNIPILSGYEGDKKEIELTAINKGTHSNEGSITISFPSIKNKNAKLLVDKSDTNIKVYATGDEIHDKNGNKIYAKYLMVEFTDTNWQKNKKNTLKFNMTFPNVGNITIYTRSTMHNKSADNYINYPSNGFQQDQQGWLVKMDTINIENRNIAYDYREFNNAEIANFNDNQMYKLGVYNKIFEMSLYQTIYYKILSDIRLERYEKLEDYKELVGDMLNIFNSYEIKKSKKIDYKTYKYIVDNVVDIVGDYSEKYYPGAKFTELYNYNAPLKSNH